MASDRTTQRYPVDELATAASALRSGSIVAFPTETVYGLGADAFNPEAIAKVFLAKGRPQDNPLIVHVSDKSMLGRVASDVPDVAQSLIDTWWPGPLTLLLPKADAIPSSVTAGLTTVAVRMPSEPVALELIRLANVPLVAPSANLSGRPSTTTWQAVAEDLDGRIDGIVCGPPARIGLESTVIDLLHDPPRVLRHGAIDFATLKERIPRLVDASQQPAGDLPHPPPSPGMKHRHYQPKAIVRICGNGPGPGKDNGPGKDASTDSRRKGWIGIHRPVRSSEYDVVVVCQHAAEYAAKLFETFRSMDRIGIEAIDCEAISNEGIGRAIMERLERATSKS